MFHSLINDGAWRRCECNSLRKATPTGHPTFAEAAKCAANELRTVAAAHKAAKKARVAVKDTMVSAWVADDEGFVYSLNGSGSTIVGYVPIVWNEIEETR